MENKKVTTHDNGNIITIIWNPKYIIIAIHLGFYKYSYLIISIYVI